MSRRITDAGSQRYFSSSAPTGETLGSRELPVLGGKRAQPLAARLAFWRSFAIVLLICMAVRVAIDLYRLAG